MNRLFSTLTKTASFALIASALAGPALADRAVTQTFSLKFDEAALVSANGATAVLADLTRQAEDVCTTVEPILRTERVDEACVADVVRQAIVAIDSGALNEAYNIAQGNQIVEPTLRASADAAIR